VIAGAIENERGVAACRHLAAYRSEMQRLGLGVRRQHDQACCDATLRTGRAEQASPVAALVMRRARASLPRLAQTRVSVPCWPIRTSSWNQISIGLPLARSGSCAVTVAATFS
jgi:hypothetical protein